MSDSDEKKVLRANSIVLEDQDGMARIILDATGKDGFAHITLFSKSRRNQIQISGQPDDRIEIALIGGSGRSSINIILTPESNNCSILLSERGGENVTTIGSFPYDEEQSDPDIVIRQNGEQISSLLDLHDSVHRNNPNQDSEKTTD